MGWQNGGQAQNRGGGGKGPGQANHGGKVLQGLLMAFSLYSRIPVPQAEWSKGGMRYAFCFFPLVGVVIGAAVAGFDCLARVAHVGEVARSCVGAALPLLLTGGIHMDGFLDTVDARSSCQPRERKLEILKDPHTGAFAIIGGGVYLLMYLAVFSDIAGVERLGGGLLPQSKKGRDANYGFRRYRLWGRAHFFGCLVAVGGGVFGLVWRACGGRGGIGGGYGGIRLLLPHGHERIWRGHGGPGRIFFTGVRIGHAGGVGVFSLGCFRFGNQ